MEYKRVKPCMMFYDYVRLQKILSEELAKNLELISIERKELRFEERKAPLLYCVAYEDNGYNANDKETKWEYIGDYMNHLKVFKSYDPKAQPIMNESALNSVISNSNVIKSMITSFRLVMVLTFAGICSIFFLSNLIIYVRLIMFSALFIAFISSFYIYYICRKIAKEKTTPSNGKAVAIVYKYGLRIASLLGTLALILYFVMI